MAIRGKTAGNGQDLEVRKSQAHLEGFKAWVFSKWALIYTPKMSPRNIPKGESEEKGQTRPDAISREALPSPCPECCKCCFLSP